MTTTYLSDTQLADRYGVHRTTPWRWVHTDPTFPKPVKMSPGCTRWKLSDIEAWEASRATDGDDWTRWKQGESIDVLARERGCTRERMRHRLKKLDEGRTVIALQAQIDEARAALALMDHYGVIIRDGDGKHMSVPLRFYEAMCRAIGKPDADG